jgi:hypothetical protein
MERVSIGALTSGFGTATVALLLKAYFDDSGTHDNSRIVVWGGLFGPASELDALDLKWRELLRAPMEGKTPLKKFRLSSCMRGWGQFERYNQAERDYVSRKFRDLIAEVDVAPVAYIVFVDDWNAALSRAEKPYLGDAQNMAFRGCLDAATRAAAGKDGQHIACFFDKGQEASGINAVLAAWEITNPEFRESVSVTFSPVSALTGLQAADTVAYEAYQYGLHLLNPAKTPLPPHFHDFAKGNGPIFMSLQKPEIDDFLNKWRRQMEKIRHCLNGGTS